MNYIMTASNEIFPQPITLHGKSCRFVNDVLHIREGEQDLFR